MGNIKAAIKKVRPRIVKNDFDFFMEWLKIIGSFSPLTEKEMSFVASLLAKRHELSKVILDDKMLYRVLFSKETKEEIVNELGLKDLQEFENKAHQLRKKNVIGDNNIINKAYIPNISKDYTSLTVAFTIVKQEEDDKGQAH